MIERRILPDELTGFSECFITGSAAEVTAVSEIAHWNFNPGGITKTLMDDYTRGSEAEEQGRRGLTFQIPLRATAAAGCSGRSSVT